MPKSTSNGGGKGGGGSSAPVIISDFSLDSGVLGDFRTNDSTLTLSGTAEPNTEVRIYADGALLGTTTSDANGDWDFTTSELADGSYSFTAETGRGSHALTSDAYMVEIDTTTPDPVITSLTVVSTGLQLSGTAEADSAITVYDSSGAEIGTTTAGDTGSWEVIDTSYDGGSVTYSIVAVDEAGNEATSADFTYSPDAGNTAPEITTSATASAPENQTFAIDVDASDDAAGLTYAITGGDDAALFTIDPATGVVSFVEAPDFESPADADANNAYLVEVTVTDAGGLTDVQSMTVNVTNVNEPASIGGTATGTVTEDDVLSAQGTLSVTDPDAGEDALQAVAAGTPGSAGHGTFEVQANGNWTYSLDNSDPAVQALGVGETLTDSITVLSQDGSASRTITVTINGMNDLPVTNPDSTSTDRDTAVIISVLANDTDPDGDALTVTGVTQGLNGTVSANGDGTLTYLPGTGFVGTDSFTYSVSDGNGGTATETVTVTVSEPPAAPTDTLYAAGEQWHIAAVGGDPASDGWTDYSRIEKVWTEFSGAGVLVGIFDDGIEYTHEDLAANYDASAHLSQSGTVYDPYPSTADQGKHGTAVAGVIAAAANGVGTVGVAWGATISGVNIFTGPANVNSSTPDGFDYVIHQMYRYDVLNHSWGGLPAYVNDLTAQTTAFMEGAATAVADGRGGLGSIIVKAAGNWSDSSQGDFMDTTRYTVTVGAYDSDGDASWYSNRGANVLVSAPSSGNTLANADGTLTAESDLRIATTDRDGGYGYSPDDWSSSHDTSGFGGTSSATPTTVGVVALMLDANPGLGWRDVQDILALSAHETGSETGALNTATEEVPVDTDSDGTFDTRAQRPVEFYAGQWNGAHDWNGGGHHVSVDYGHGAVDAYNAVRMSEVWNLFGPAQTSANEVNATTGLMTPNLSVSGEGSSASYSFDVSNVDLDLEYVDITVALGTTLMQEVDLELESPSGTTAVLLDLPLNDYTPAYSFFGIMLMPVTITWTFGAHTFKGEDPNGTWTLHLTEKDVTYDVDNFGTEADGNTIKELTLDFHGGAASEDDVYHYTDEMVTLGLNDGPRPALDPVSDRVSLSDAAGTDWLDMAAMTYDLTVDLTGGATARTATGPEALATFADGTIENAVTGDGSDILLGNDGANELHGMRGNDRLEGGRGDDTLAGGAGNDTFFFGVGDGRDLILDFADGEDLVSLSGFSSDQLVFAQSGADTVLSFGNPDDSITFAGVSPDLLGPDDFLLATA